MTYYSDFKDFDENSLRLEIQTSGSGSKEVKLLSDAMTIEYSGESIFDALRPSRASVNLFVADIIPTLFSGTLNSVSVKLYKNSSLFWFGYVQPNVYTQSYQGNYDTLTIEAIDTVAQLENVDYTYIDKSDDVGIFSFLEVLANCFDSVDKNHEITDFYVDSTIAVNGSSPILDNLFIKERNFFDEKEEAMKCDEVVSSIMQYLGLTLIQYKSAYYAISSDKLNSDYTLTHYTYSNSSNTWQQCENVTLSLPLLTTAQIGQSGSNVTVSLGGVYNKVTVIANNNPLDNILPEQDDSDDIVNQNADPNKQYIEDYTAPDGNAYKLISGFFKSKKNWTYTQPHNITTGDINEVTVDNRGSISAGVFWQNVAEFKTADGEPSSLNRKLWISMVSDNTSVYIPYLQLNTHKTMIIDGGYLIVNLKYKFSTDYRAHSAVKSMYDSAATFGSCSDLTWTSYTDYVGAAGWPNNTMFLTRLTVGDYYYDGEKWDTIAAQQARQTYYESVYSGLGWDWAGTTNRWFRTWNSTHDVWDYVTEDFYINFVGSKESGNCPYADAIYVHNNFLGGAVVYIPEEFYYEFLQPGYFYLMHVNKTNEPIYDVEYSLTNTVSYKMQITNATDGVAIKCPTDFTMYGQLNFQIFACDKLGHNPQWRSDKATTTLRAIHISDLSIAYSKSAAQEDIYHPINIDPDTIYSNTVDENYCKELEDIELKINSQNDWATSYSYVIGKSDGQFKYVTSLTFGSSTKKPEERLVQRLVDYYRQPKFIFSRDVHNQSTEIHPFQPILEEIGGSTKQLVTTASTYNVSQNTVNITTNEI